MKRTIFIVIFLHFFIHIFGEIHEARENSDGLYGFVDRRGKWIVPPIYYLTFWNEEDKIGEARVKSYEDESLIYDAKGKLLFPSVYKEVYRDKECGLLHLKKGERKPLDPNILDGNPLPLSENEHVEDLRSLEPGSGKLSIVSYYWGIGDFSGNIIIPCDYTTIVYLAEYKAFLVEKQTEDQIQMGLIDMTGEIIVPCQFQEIKVATENIYRVKNMDGKYGYYAHGIEIIPCVYDSATLFKDDIAKVTKDGEIKLINNPLHNGMYDIAVINNKSRRKIGEAISRYPLPNSDVDLNIPMGINTSNNKFALIIANENYEMSPVPYALNDGRIFKKYCNKSMGIPKENIFIYEDATYATLVSAIQHIKDLADAFDGEAEFLIYYAGHGVPDEESKSAFLLPIDGYISDITGTGISLKEVYSDLSTLRTKNITILIDACFSGAKRENEMLLSGRGVAIKVNEEVPKGNIVVFSASTGNETAHQLADKTHGLFTYYLLKGIQQSNGNISLGELSDYVTKNVRRQSVVINSKKQTPTVIPSANMADRWRDIKL